MGTRKRIKRGFVEGSGVIEDTLEYKRNRSTERARKIGSILKKQESNKLTLVLEV